MSELVVRAARGDDHERLQALRREVFAAEQGIAAELIADADDAQAVQVVALRDGLMVGTGRMVVRGRSGRIGRVATRRTERGRGVGTAVMIELERRARELGLVEVEVHAQITARGFYDGLGYQPVGEPFSEAGLAHLSMRKPVPLLRPARDADSQALIELIGGCFAEYPGCVLDVDAEEPWLRRPASAYAEQGGALWVVELAGAVVACVGHKPHAGAPSELKNLYVAAAARRQGLGGYLVGVVERAARGSGATTVELWSDTRFLDAHRLYARRGYQKAKRTRELHDRSATVEYQFAHTL